VSARRRMKTGRGQGILPVAQTPPTVHSPSSCGYARPKFRHLLRQFRVIVVGWPGCSVANKGPGSTVFPPGSHLDHPPWIGHTEHPRRLPGVSVVTRLASMAHLRFFL
jgi:hypothetical protein